MLNGFLMRKARPAAAPASPHACPDETNSGIASSESAQCSRKLNKVLTLFLYGNYPYINVFMYIDKQTIINSDKLF